MAYCSNCGCDLTRARCSCGPQNSPAVNAVIGFADRAIFYWWHLMLLAFYVICVAMTFDPETRSDFTVLATFIPPVLLWLCCTNSGRRVLKKFGGAKNYNEDGTPKQDKA